MLTTCEKSLIKTTAEKERATCISSICAIAGRVGMFKIKVEVDNFPDTDYLKLTDRRYVYLSAKVGRVTRSTLILVSGNVANVFIQTDKPLYTPGQTGG